MDKRTITFIALSSLVLIGYFALSTWLAPPRPPARPPVAADKDRAGGDADRTERTDADLAGPVPPAETADRGKVPAASVAAGDESGRTAVVDDSPADVREEALVSLGSLDGASPLKLLATLSTRGASIVRVELNSARHRDLDIERAWLGSLALVDAPDPADPKRTIGLTVRAVGPGTPAAKAGLAVGDLLVAIDGAPVRSVQGVRERLDPIRPGQTVALDVLSGPDRRPRSVTVTAERAPVSVIGPREADTRPGDGRASYACGLVNGSDVLQGRAGEARALASLKTRNWTLVPATPAPADGPSPDGSSPEDAPIDATPADPAESVRPVPATTGSAPRPAGEEVVFETRLTDADLKQLGWTGPVTLRKVYVLREPAGPADPGLHLTMRLEVDRTGAEGGADSPTPFAWSIDGPAGLPDEGWWYANKIHQAWFAAVGARDVIWDTAAGGHKLLGAPEITTAVHNNEPQDLLLFSASAGGAGPDTRKVRYIGVDAQYFVAAMLPGAVPPEAGATLAAWEARAVAVGPVNVETSVGKKSTDTSFVLTTEPAAPAAGVTAEEYTLAFLPKEPETLAPYGLDESVYYGWFWWVTVPLLWVLHFFHGIVGNYGIAIMMLTVLVRLCLMPLSFKMAQNAAKMQSLAPEMKALKEKYPEDPMKMQQAQRDLFKRHNFNPLGGCWMAFVQLPIFMGLYRGLATDVELRGEPLIPGLRWASDLSGPDMLLYWGTGTGAGMEWLFSATGWLGPWLNLLPLGTVGLFLLQQKLFMPPATDEQTRAQQRMMTMMMIVIGLMFFKVPSGLCVYFLTSSTWAICERLILKRFMPPPPAPLAGAETSSDGRPSGGTKPVLDGTLAAPPQPSKRRARNA